MAERYRSEHTSVMASLADPLLTLPSDGNRVASSCSVRVTNKNNRDAGIHRTLGPWSLAADSAPTAAALGQICVKTSYDNRKITPNS